MKLSFWGLLIALLAAITLSACINDDFDSSSTNALSFSTDTVAFDTVITLQQTATKQMVVYNKSDKQVKISSISVAGLAEKGKFYLNVDGQKGESFNDIEIRGKDSIYVFIEAYFNEMQKDDPTMMTDRIDFVTNNSTQSVVLTAWGQDVIRLYGDTISSNTTFTAGKPYLIYDTLFVSPNVTLTINAGATLLFHDKGAMRVAGRMLANGTQEKPITFRGDRLDHVVGSISFDIMSGQWGGIIFTPPTMGNELRYVNMRGSSIGMNCSATDTTQRCLYLYNCLLHNSAACCLAAAGCWIDAVGTEFSNAAEELFYMAGCKVNAAQCTFANYYLFTSENLPLLTLDEAQLVYPDGTTVNLQNKVRFDNCIIYPYSTANAVVSPTNFDGKDVMFRYCLFRSNGTDDSNFINCVWDSDPLFYADRDEYIFDFRLQEGSPAIGAGNASLCPTNANYDRYGNYRFVAGGTGVDIGAYAYSASDTPTN